MKRREAAEFALEELRREGAEKCQVIANGSEKQELNVEAGELSLFRTVLNGNLSIRAIRGGRLGQTSVNKFDRTSIESAVREVMQVLAAAAPDPAYDVAPAQPPRSFEHGIQRPDRDLMYRRLSEMLEDVKKKYPRIILEGVHLDYSRSETTLLNSSGVAFDSQQGHYGFSAMFTAKEGGKASSFNYTGGSLLALDRPLLDCFGLEELLRQSSEQTETRSLPGKFTGDLVLTPHSLPDLLGAYLGFLRDGSLIAGTSVFREKLGAKIASPLLSIKSEPRGENMAVHEFFDADGFESRAMEIISEGELKTFLLSLYGSRKTGKEKAKSSGGNLVVAGGATPYEELVRGVKRGILLGRFSGGRPSENGDFSGVAKNSYYVEDGKILYPVSETMISGNLVQLFQDLAAVSRETIAYGSSVYPWMRAPGVTISGK